MLDERSAVWVEQWRTYLPELAGRVLRLHALDLRQRRALWRELVRESVDNVNLLNADAIAVWASQAWSTLRHWDLTRDGEFRDSETLTQLREWGRRYEQILEARGWKDTDRILTKFAAGAEVATLTRLRRRIELLALEPPSALERRCLDLLRSAGWAVASRDFPHIESRVSVHSATSSTQELELALEWLLERLERQPDQRVALVLSDAGSHEAQMLRLFHDYENVAFSRGRSPLSMPPVSAALNALEMLGPEGHAKQLSGWLRSPFMHGCTPDSLGAGARFELEWRQSLLGQLPLRNARAALLRQLAVESPAAAGRLDRAYRLAEEAGQVAPPADWTQLWRRQLEALGWLAEHSGSERERFVAALERAFDAVAALTPVLGAVSATRALAELRSVLSEKLLGSPLPLAGVHVLDRIDDLGPGYAAVWVTGLSRSNWPPRPRANPLLPHALQRRLGIPWATSEDCRARARRYVDRAAHSAPEVVFSYAPGAEEDIASPAAVIAPWRDLRSLPRASSGRAHDAVPATSGNLEEMPESMRPIAAGRLGGGASLLNMQARCPLRAYIEYRLHARPLEPLARGISPAVRGQILHRAAALLLPTGTSPTLLAAMSQTDRKARVSEAARRAVHAELGEAAKWLAALGEFEQQRAAQALEMLLEAESGRSGFSVSEVEKDIGLVVDGFEIRGRVDRVDSLDTGGLAVIDYKTGRSVARPYWFDDDHADYQLPLYAVAIGDSVTSMALCSLHPDGCVYRGFWPVEGSFPGRSEKLPGERTWKAQRDRWRIEIEALIGQFVAGADLVRTDDLDVVRGPFAPLTRLAEALPTCGEAKRP